MAGSPCVTYKSIKRVPRRIAGCTMPTIPRPNASSSGVNVVTPLAFCVLLPACDGSVRSVALELLLATTLWPRRARPPSCAKPSERTTRARSVWLVRFCSIVRSASWLARKTERVRVANRPLGRNSAPEIPLPKPCGLGKASASARGYPTPGKGRPKRKSLRSKYVRGKNANTGENRTLCSPSAYSAVKGTPGLSELGATVAPLRDWAGSITAKYWLEPYTKKCVRKGEGGKNFG